MKLIVCCIGVALGLTLACTGAESKANGSQGKQIFAQTCLPCHNVDTDARKMGPSLKGLYKHAKLENGQKVTDQTVRAQIATGGKQMPHYAEGPNPILSPAEMNDVLAYLKTL